MSLKLINEYKQLSRRKYREKKGKSIIEGYYLLQEALRAGSKIEAVFYTKEFLKKETHKELLYNIDSINITTIEVSNKTFEQVAQTETPQGVGAIIHLHRWGSEFIATKSALFLILDGLQDPGNVGTIIRTAAAAGLHGILILPGTADPFNPKALRSSMGGIFHLPVVQQSGFEWYEESLNKGVQFVAAAPLGNSFYYEVDYTVPTGIIIGNESKGVNEYLLEKATVTASIPLPGKIDSINASAAASVFMFEANRQRALFNR